MTFTHKIYHKLQFIITKHCGNNNNNNSNKKIKPTTIILLKS